VKPRIGIQEIPLIALDKAREEISGNLKRSREARGKT
jgi:hypothetical protein